jgi:hypothetical protein
MISKSDYSWNRRLDWDLDTLNWEGGSEKSGWLGQLPDFPVETRRMADRVVPLDVDN